MWVSFINESKEINIWTKSWKTTINWIQNENQSVDGVDIDPKADSHYHLFIGRHFIP